MSTSISVDGIILSNKPLTNVELIDSAKKLRIPLFRGCSFEMRYRENLTKMKAVY